MCNFYILENTSTIIYKLELNFKKIYGLPVRLASSAYDLFIANLKKELISIGYVKMLIFFFSF
jgi:hypothetical protein